MSGSSRDWKIGYSKFLCTLRHTVQMISVDLNLELKEQIQIFFLILKVGRTEEITETETIIEGATINLEEENESSRNRGSPTEL